MPTTWALPPAKRCWSAFSAGASLFQVFVNANAKNASPTLSVFVSLAIFVRPFGACGTTHLD